MSKRKGIIGVIAVVCCCIVIGIGVKVTAEKGAPEDKAIKMNSEIVTNKTVEEKDGTLTNTTTVTSEPANTESSPSEQSIDEETDFSIK